VYDLFGPTVAQWELKTEREFLVRGVGWTVLPGYIITFIALQVYSLFGRGGQVKYVFPPLLYVDGSGDTYYSSV
jgi:hypothetical protein